MVVKNSCARMSVENHWTVENTNVRKSVMKEPVSLAKKFHLNLSIALAEEKK